KKEERMDIEQLMPHVEALVFASNLLDRKVAQNAGKKEKELVSKNNLHSCSAHGVKRFLCTIYSKRLLPANAFFSPVTQDLKVLIKARIRFFFSEIIAIWEMICG